MAKHPALSSYAKIIGEIAIAWNKLEIRLDGLIFQYLPIESEVAGFILGQLGNQTKADLAKILIERYETNAEIKENALFCISLLNRLRENRNILEHSIPHLNYSRNYAGMIAKRDAKGYNKPFVAPMALLKELSSAMKHAETYIMQVRLCLSDMKAENDASAFDEKMRSALTLAASRQRPQLPKKISPLWRFQKFLKAVHTSSDHLVRQNDVQALPANLHVSFAGLSAAIYH